MLRSKTIRSLAALLLLFAFTLGITPKLYLHDILAGHTDTPVEVNYEGHERVSQSGFHCDVNNLVATSPFTDEANEVALICPAEYYSFQTELSSLFIKATYSFIESRGPPALG